MQKRGIAAIVVYAFGRVPALCEKGLHAVREWLIKGAWHVLAQSDQGNDEYTVVRYVLVCLVLLLLSVGAFYGEGVNLAVLLPHVNGTGGGGSAGELDKASWWLYLCVPVFLGVMHFEFLDMPLFGVRLFPKIDEKKKKWYKRVILVSLGLACLVFMCLWLYRDLSLSYPQAVDHPAQDITGQPFGLSFSLADVRWVLFLCMALVAFITLYFVGNGLKIGLLGLSAFLLGVLIVVAVVLEFFPFHVAAQLLAVPCVFLSQGKLTPYIELAELKQLAMANGEQETVVPYALLPGGEIMKTEKVGSVVFAGQLGSDLYDHVVNEVRLQRGADVLCTSGGFARSARRERFVLPGTESISPKEADIQQALGTDASDAHVYTKLLNRMAEYLKKTHGEKGLRAEPATLLFVLDRSILVYAEDMLRNIKNALRGSSLLVLTAFSLEDLRDATVQAGKEVLEVLWQDGVLETTLVVDPLHAPFREAEDKQTLYRFLSRGVMSLLIANKQYRPNLSSVEALTQLHASSPFMTVSFASAPVSPGTLPGRYGWRSFLPGGNTPRGAGDLMLTINTTTELITQVLDPAHPKHSETRAFNAAVSQQGSAFVVCNIPLTQQEEEKLEQAKQRLDWYVDTKYPFATALLSRANGVPYANQLPSSYLAQANCFYAIHPGIFSLAPTVEAGKRTVLLPQATPGTVGTPAEEAKEAEASSQSLVPVVEEQSAGANGAKPATNGSQAVKPATRRGRPKKDSSR